MAIQSSGAITIADIAAEFGGSSNRNLKDYYGQGGAPASGAIRIKDFYGAQNGPVRTVSQQIWTTTTAYGTPTTINIGAAAANRYVVVAVEVSTGYGQSRIAGLQINGINATGVTKTNNSYQTNGIFYANVPTGTTATVGIHTTPSQYATSRLTAYTVNGITGNHAGASAYDNSSPFTTPQFGFPANTNAWVFGLFNSERLEAGTNYSWNIPGSTDTLWTFNGSGEGGLQYARSHIVKRYPPQAPATRTVTLTSSPDRWATYGTVTGMVIW